MISRHTGLAHDRLIAEFDGDTLYLLPGEPEG
jgi:hypothetical protein